jgi:hypothetical protein
VRLQNMRQQISQPLVRQKTGRHMPADQAIMQAGGAAFLIEEWLQ